MAATNLNLEIPQGGTFQLVIDITAGPADLSGYTGHMQIRDVPGGEILEDLTPSVNPSTRQMLVEIPSANTKLYDWNYGSYDVKLVGAAGDWRVLEGRIIVNHSVTQEA